MNNVRATVARRHSTTTATLHQILNPVPSKPSAALAAGQPFASDTTMAAEGLSSGYNAYGRCNKHVAAPVAVDSYRCGGIGKEIVSEPTD